MSWILLSLCVLAAPEDETRDKVRALIKRLENSKEPAAWTAAQELGELGSAAKDAIPALRKLLEAKPAADRGHAAAALLLIDQAEAGQAFPVLRGVFKDRKEVLTQLGLIKPLGSRLRPATKEVVAGLLQLAAEGEASGWIIGDMALGRIEPRNKQAMSGLADGLKHESLDARVLAARFLARLDPDRVKDAVPNLREGLTHKDMQRKLVAAEALIELDPKQKKVIIEELTPGLRDGHAGTRTRIAVFFLDIDPDLAGTATPVLREVIKGTVSWEAEEGLRSLTRLAVQKRDRFKQVFPLFEEVLKGEDESLRLQAMKQLGQMGPIAQPAETLLRRATTRDKPEAAVTAIEALMRIRPENATERIARFLELIEKRDRTANGIKEFVQRFESLRKMQETKSGEPWIQGLAEMVLRSDRDSRDGWTRDELLRLYGIAELGALGAKAAKAVPALTEVVKDRDSVKPLLRAQAVFALGRIGKASREAIPVLNRIGRDDREAPDLRAAAREALRMIDRDKDS